MSDLSNPFELLSEIGNDETAENPFASTFEELSDEGVENPFEITREPEPEPAAPEKVKPTAQESDEEPENPLMAAVGATEQASIYAKLPVFKYGSAEEEIEDVNQTFEDLRVAKSGDFPELEDANRVTWVVTYGKITKNVYGGDAKKKKIGEFKKSIEMSKDFTTALKKSKDKNPTCEIKPRVTAQSKGEQRTAAPNLRCAGETKQLSSYKALFTSLEDVDSSGKLICLVPGSDGKIYEIRNEEMGRFITPAGRTGEFSEMKAGFIPALPLISSHQLLQIISFFRSYLTPNGSYEAIANILWDRYEKAFVTVVPKQSVESARAKSDLSDFIDTDRYLHYMDIHSHNVMNAKFSEIDDRDEKATRLYAVVGRLDNYFPRIKLRMSNGGKFHEIDPGLVFEQFWMDYPNEWDGQVTRTETRCVA